MIENYGLQVRLMQCYIVGLARSTLIGWTEMLRAWSEKRIENWPINAKCEDLVVLGLSFACGWRHVWVVKMDVFGLTCGVARVCACSGESSVWVYAISPKYMYTKIGKQAFVYSENLPCKSYLPLLTLRYVPPERCVGKRTASKWDGRTPPSYLASLSTI